VREVRSSVKQIGLRRSMYSFRMAAVLLFLVVMFTSGTQSESKSKAPNFVLKTSDGKTLELKKLAGKVVVVNFWATWCGPCRAEIPGMIEVYERYRSKGLEIVGVSLDLGGWDRVKPYVDRAKITYPIVIGDGNLADAYGGIEAIPTTFFIDKQGNIIEKHLGYMSKADFEERVKKIL
jgi:thiol-disulfide isomerase/thioredoxin